MPECLKKEEEEKEKKAHPIKLKGVFANIQKVRLHLIFFDYSREIFVPLQLQSRTTKIKKRRQGGTPSQHLNVSSVWSEDVIDVLLRHHILIIQGKSFHSEIKNKIY